MIDSILIFRELKQLEFKIVMNSLSKVTKVCNPTNLIKFKAKVKNLRLVISPVHLIIKGSIPKFYCNELGNLTRQGIERAFTQLGDVLGISLENSFVYKVELSRIILLNYPINFYFPIFTKYPYLKKKEYSTSLVFHNKRKSISIYDKTPLLKNDEVNLLPKNKSLIKCEIRLKNKVKHQLWQFYIKQQLEKGITYGLENSTMFSEGLKVKDLYSYEGYSFLYDYFQTSFLNFKVKSERTYLYKEFIKMLMSNKLM